MTLPKNIVVDKKDFTKYILINIGVSALIFIGAILFIMFYKKNEVIKVESPELIEQIKKANIEQRLADKARDSQMVKYQNELSDKVTQQSAETKSEILRLSNQVKLSADETNKNIRTIRTYNSNEIRRAFSDIEK